MENNQRIKILFLCDYQAPYGGNFLASLVQLDQALKDRDVTALYVFPTGASQRPWYRPWTQGGRKTYLLDTGTSLFQQRRFLLHLIDQEDVSILHVHFGLFLLSELTALKRKNLRLILHFHSDFSAGKAPGIKERLRDAGKKFLEKRIGTNRITKITVSQASARTTADCISIHNALVTQRFTTDCKNREETRRMFGIDETQKFLVMFGWSPYIKGVDVAAKAVNIARQAGHGDYVLGIAGGREYTKEKMAAFLREKAGLKGDESWLVYLDPVEDVFRYHLASDLFISASRSETFSYALLEALYAGRPCAVSDIPGVQWAREYDTVVPFPSQDSAELARALPKALATPAERLTQVSTAVTKEYAISGWVNAMLRVYGLM